MLPTCGDGRSHDHLPSGKSSQSLSLACLLSHTPTPTPAMASTHNALLLLLCPVKSYLSVEAAYITLLPHGLTQSPEPDRSLLWWTEPDSQSEDPISGLTAMLAP